MVVTAGGDDLESHARLIPFVRGKIAIGGKATAYVCDAGSCQLPATGPELFARQLEEITPLGEAVE